MLIQKRVVRTNLDIYVFITVLNFTVTVGSSTMSIPQDEYEIDPNLMDTIGD